MISHARAAPDAYSLSSSPCSPLKYQRLLRGWSQKDVATALYQLCTIAGSPGAGVNEDMVSRWENGRSKPSPLYRKHLCTLYGQTAAELGLLGNLEVIG